MYQRMEDGNEYCEIHLPSSDEILQCITVKAKEDCFTIMVEFPAQRIGALNNGTTVYRMPFDYIPPPVHEK